mmetsp:Transcript_38936/g.125869  ORF Transcript_38936/g.125869 Transcript_38936/m.125869 type:complete len:213 (-) Transcript_38936:212-850(-)
MSPTTLPLCPHSPEPDGAIYSAPLPPHSTASWAGNLLGSILLAVLVTAGGTLGEAAAAQKIAFGKTHEPQLVVLVRAVLCNWLVCMATYMSLQAKDTTGKFVAIWLPISAFVALGLEHTVANMFLLPLGILNGADTSWTEALVHNLLPVTLGNTAGALLGVALPFSFGFGAVGEKLLGSAAPPLLSDAARSFAWSHASSARDNAGNKATDLV